MNIITAQKEKAREGWREHSRSHGRVNYDDEHEFLDTLITNTVHAVLEKVREGMPNEETPVNFHPCAGSGKGHGHPDRYAAGWNAYRTALLQHLDDMKKEI